MRQKVPVTVWELCELEYSDRANASSMSIQRFLGLEKQLALFPSFQ